MNSTETFEGLVESCISYYEAHKKETNEDVLKTRKHLKQFIEKFHKESNTLDEKVKHQIENLDSESSLILMTAHQPNLLPYSGVLRKSTLLYALQTKIKEKLGVDVVSFYGIADQDFTDDRWVKSTVLPSITKKGGLLTLSINLPEKVILNSVPKPDGEIITKWEESLRSWLKESTSEIRKYCGKNGFEWEPISKNLENNFDELWNYVESAYAISRTYSDFNSFVMSKIINEAWGYDTLFARFSESQRIFEDEFTYILNNFDAYSSSLREILEKSSTQILGGVADFEPGSIPFWHHCECGGKTRLEYTQRNREILGKGVCSNCGKLTVIELGEKNNTSIKEIKEKISARAIPMILVFSKGLNLTCYVGGVGGREYLDEAKYISEKININLPVIGYWRPRDFYISLCYVESILEYLKISKNFEIAKWEKQKETILNKIDQIYYEIQNLENKRKIIKENKVISQEEFISEMKKISKEINELKNNNDLTILQANIKELENIPQVYNNIPSIIDYAINIGLKNTSSQWIEYLDKKGSLLNNLKLTSNLENTKCIKDDISEEIYKMWNSP
jgi:hypothetical protein